MTTENPLLDQARTSIQKRETDRLQQEEADRICGDIRLMSEGLLEQYGSPKRSTEGRLEIIVYSASVIGLPIMALGELMVRKSGGSHIWENKDYSKWVTTQNTTGSEIRVEMTAMGGIDPLKAEHVDIEVQGLAESLRLYKDYGNIRYFPSGNKKRRVNLEDAQNWQKFVTTLHEQSSHS